MVYCDIIRMPRKLYKMELGEAKGALVAGEGSVRDPARAVSGVRAEATVRKVTAAWGTSSVP